MHTGANCGRSIIIAIVVGVVLIICANAGASNRTFIGAACAKYVACIPVGGRDFDDASFTAADRTDPNLLLVDYLGVLQEELLTVLMADVPPDGDG